MCGMLGTDGLVFLSSYQTLWDVGGCQSTHQSPRVLHSEKGKAKRGISNEAQSEKHAHGNNEMGLGWGGGLCDAGMKKEKRDEFLSVNKTESLKRRARI